MGALEKARRLEIIKKAEIRHHSYVDLIGLLKALPVWFNKSGYFFFEKGLSEKDIGAGHEVESEWTATKEVTRYVKFEFEIRILARDVRKVVLENGEEVYWSRLVIVLNGALEKDYRKRFSSIWYEDLLRQFYERYFFLDDMKKYIGKLIAESVDLSTTMRSYLK